MCLEIQCLAELWLVFPRLTDLEQSLIKHATSICLVARKNLAYAKSTRMLGPFFFFFYHRRLHLNYE